MKWSLLIALLFAFSGLAQDKKAEKLTRQKAEVTENLTRHIQEIERAKTCVNGAASREAVKSCTKQMHEAVKTLKEGRRAARKVKRAEMKEKNTAEAIKRIDEKIKKLEAKKAELSK